MRIAFRLTMQVGWLADQASSSSSRRLQTHRTNLFVINRRTMPTSSVPLCPAAVAVASEKAAILGSATQVQENARTQDRVKLVERGRLKFFENPSMWRENNKRKRNLKYLDFVHATTGKALLVDSCFCPKWVQLELTFLQDSSPAIGPGVRACYRKIAGAGFRSGSTFHGAGRAGNAVGKTLPQRNEFYWTKLISDHTKCGRGREALRIYKEMRKEGVTPKTYTFVAALKACSSTVDLEAGKEIHAHATESGDQSDIFVANTLVDMYTKCGSMADARQVFETGL